MYQLFDPVHYEAIQPPFYEPDLNILLSISDQEILKKLRPKYNKRKAQIQKDFETSLKTSLCGPQNAAALAKLADEMVTDVANYIDKGANVTRKGKKLNLALSKLTICATNHYGLGFSLPYAPLNIICLTEEGPETLQEPILHILRLLWEIGFKVRARAVKTTDFLKEALSNGNAVAQLISLRPIVGNHEIAKKLTAEFHEQLSPEQKHRFALEFHDARKRRYQQHRGRLLDADLLNYSGGLRDICSLSLLAMFSFPEITSKIVCKDNNPLCSYLPQFQPQERDKLRYIWSFYWTILSLLQYRLISYTTKLPPELLPIIAHDLGYKNRRNRDFNAVQRFLRHCYHAFRITQRLLWVINPYFLEASEVQKEDTKSYEILTAPDGGKWMSASPLGRLYVSHEALVEKPTRILEALEVARQRGLKISWSLQRSIVRLAYAKLTNPKAIEWPLLLNALTEPPLHPEPNPATVLSLSRILLVWVPHWYELVGYFENDEIEHRGYSLDERIIKMFQLYQKIELAAHGDTSDAGLFLISDIFRSLSEKHALFVAILAYRTPQIFGLKRSLEITESLSQLFKLSFTEASKAYRLVLCQNLLVDVILSKDKVSDIELMRLSALIQTPNFLKLLFVLTVLILKPNADWDHWLQPLALSLYEKLDGRLTPYKLLAYEPYLISLPIHSEQSPLNPKDYSEYACRKLLEETKKTEEPTLHLKRFRDLKAVQINIVAQSKKHPMSNILQRITNIGYLIFKTRFSELSDGYYALIIYVHYPDDLPAAEDGGDIHKSFSDQIEYHLKTKTSLRSPSEVTASIPLHPMKARILWVLCLKEEYIQLELTLFYVLNRAPNIVKILEMAGVELIAGRIERAGTKEVYVIQLAPKNAPFTPELAQELTKKLGDALTEVCAKGVLEETTTLFTV